MYVVFINFGKRSREVWNLLIVAVLVLLVWRMASVLESYFQVRLLVVSWYTLVRMESMELRVSCPSWVPCLQDVCLRVVICWVRALSVRLRVSSWVLRAQSKVLTWVRISVFVVMPLVRGGLLFKIMECFEAGVVGWDSYCFSFCYHCRYCCLCLCHFLLFFRLLLNHPWLSSSCCCHLYLLLP